MWSLNTSRNFDKAKLCCKGEGERHYLRLLLTLVAGPASFALQSIEASLERYAS